MTNLKPILIAGPTASGKSGLALAIAREFDGWVVNADASQVYQDLQVISARPSEAEMCEVPHKLYGHVRGDVAYSTGAWLADVAKVLAEARALNKRVVIVGGTGLYFYGLLEGLADVPEIAPEIREKWRAQAETLEAGQLFEVLQSKDPLMADVLNPADKQRIVRALEVRESTGTSLKVWQETAAPPLLAFEATVPFVLALDRAILYERINQRFAEMVETGGLEEVRVLLEKGYEPGLPVMRALGVRELQAHLAGACSLEDAVQVASQQTRRYAKRQLSWLRRNMISWMEVDAQQMECSLPDIFSKIRNFG